MAIRKETAKVSETRHTSGLFVTSVVSALCLLPRGLIQASSVFSKKRFRESHQHLRYRGSRRLNKFHKGRAT
jgi:hypothetical protein